MSDTEDDTFRLLTRTMLRDMLKIYGAWLTNPNDSRNWNVILKENGWTESEWKERTNRWPRELN